ncbi:MAG TPA: hypothetical protein VJO34_11815 [Methylomirabilota bacterium]|nr:hypothetical protein [Methylomirabilota bacterium]
MGHMVHDIIRDDEVEAPFANRREETIAHNGLPHMTKSTGSKEQVWIELQSGDSHRGREYASRKGTIPNTHLKNLIAVAEEVRQFLLNVGEFKGFCDQRVKMKGVLPQERVNVIKRL